MIREATTADIKDMLRLYAQLRNRPIPQVSEGISSTWQSILADPNHHVIVYEQSDEIISSCICLIIPDLTHGLRPKAIIMNLITDERYRRQGFGSACMGFAQNLAFREGCAEVEVHIPNDRHILYEFMLSIGYQTDTAFNICRKPVRPSRYATWY
ncbi:GNAT family N-acetyltransferase [Bifidobacterium gallicum]|nr:GNAT family N-acetyltransferase [Bifidobacterium gallicum]KFI58670.1 acetyltransferase, GNAT family [Bifidobacterium gallicum DSM 20093 = LMG 11596]